MSNLSPDQRWRLWADGWDRRLLLYCAIIVAALFIARLATCADVTTCLTQTRGDFHTYRNAAMTWLEGGNPYEVKQPTAWIYPPLSVLFFVPFAFEEPLVAQFMYYVGMAVAFVLWLYFLARLSGERMKWVTPLLTLVVFLPAVHHAITFGQVTLFCSALLAYSVWCTQTERPIAAAIALVIATMIKPLEFAYWWPCITRYWDRKLTGQETVGCVLAIGGFVWFLSLVFQGFAPWLEWQSILWSVRRARGYMFPLHYLVGSSVWMALALRKEK